MILGLGGYYLFSARQPDHSRQSANTGAQPRTTYLSPGQILAKPNQYLDKTIMATGRLHFEVTCPPADESGNGQCVSTGYLVSSGKAWSHEESKDQIRLYEGNSFVGCSDQSQPPTCGDWVNQKDYQVTGTLKYLTIQGRPSNTLIIEVNSKQTL